MPELIEVRALTEYTPEVAADLGRLTVFLDATLPGDPIPEQQLRRLIESAAYEQLVAESSGKIIGAATLTQIGGIMPGGKAYLEDFVTSADVRRQGVGDQIWQQMERWCIDRGLTKLDFTSSYDRSDAHAFYESHGAKIRTETAPFRAIFTKNA